ncbi:MAG: iron ABC transporter permease, partial [Roseibacillus sp.]
MNNRNAIFLTSLVTLLFGVFFIYPVLMVIGEAFYDEESGFTLAYVGEVFANPVYLEGIWNALLLGITSTLASLLIAFPLALLTHRYGFPLKGPLSALILVPLVLPPFVGAVGVKQMLGVKGAFNAFLEKFGLMDPEAPVDWLGEG